MGEPLTPAQLRGAYALSDLTAPVLMTVRPRCGRRERYNVARPMERHGDVPLPSLRTIVSKSDHAGRNSFGRCGLVYEEPPGAWAAVALEPWSPSR